MNMHSVIVQSWQYLNLNILCNSFLNLFLQDDIIDNEAVFKLLLYLRRKCSKCLFYWLTDAKYITVNITKKKVIISLCMYHIWAKYMFILWISHSLLSLYCQWAAYCIFETISVFCVLLEYLKKKKKTALK